MERGSGKMVRGSGQYGEGEWSVWGEGVVQQVQTLIGLPLPRTPPVNRQVLFCFDPALDL